MIRSLVVVMAFGVGAWWARSPLPTPALADGRAPDFSSVIAACDASVVEITTQAAGATLRSRDDNVGSGFVVGADGWILTNRHVVSGARQVTVLVPGRGRVVGTVVGVDDVVDVALLRVPLTGLVPLRMGDPAALRKGQWLLCAGSPYRLSNSWSAGIVSGLGRSDVGVNPKGYQSYIQTDAAANLGNSGGPVLDAQGAVVGIMTAILSRSGAHMGVSLAVPIDAALRSVQAWLSGGAPPPRASLGARVRAAADGLQVTGLDAGSAAQRAGLLVGDVLLFAGSRPLRDAADLQEAVWQVPSPGSVVVRLRRGAQVLDATVRFP